MVIGLILSLALLITLALGSYIFIKDILHSVDEIMEESVEELLPIAHLQSIINRSATPANDYIISLSPAERGNFDRLTTELALAFDTALSSEFGERELDLIQQAQLEWLSASELSMTILSLENPTAYTDLTSTIVSLDHHTQIAVTIMDQLLTQVIHEIKEHAAHAHGILNQLTSLAIVVLVGGFLIVFYLTHFTLFSILTPLQRLLTGTHRFAEGDLNYLVRIKAHNEIGKLTAAFNQMASKLSELTNRDELTGLYNRRFMNHFLAAEIKRSQRYHHHMGLLMIDADHFKHINDAHGHAVGDQVLVLLSQIVLRTLREMDVVCRYGGEELIAILPEETDSATLLLTAERVRRAVEQELVRCKDQTEVRLTISIGAALYPTHAEDAEGLLKAADTALYRAKDEGRNRSIISGDS